MARLGDAATGIAAIARLSLQEIEHDDWGDPLPDDTGLVTRCMLLRRKPLGEFDDDDLLEMIGQQISPDILVPMALGMLTTNPWLSGIMYPGALLENVARVDDEYWQAHPDQAAVLQRIVDGVIATLAADPGFMPTDWPDAYPGTGVRGITRVPGSYWGAHPQQLEEMRRIVARACADGVLDQDDLDYADPIFSAADGSRGRPGS